MPLSSIIILTGIVSLFATFMLVLGGVSGWIAVCDHGERKAELRGTTEPAVGAWRKCGSPHRSAAAGRWARANPSGSGTLRIEAEQSAKSLLGAPPIPEPGP